jgi:alpha-beta hydrolase superfamily lysophospholipase
MPPVRDTSPTVHHDALTVLGGPTLHRRWATPADPAWARLAVLPGYGDHGGRHDHVLRWMAGHGVAAHVIDFRGHGRSGGRVGYVRRWAEYLDDLSAFLAIEELATSDGPPLFVLAHSHGGLIAAAAAQRGLLDGRRCRGVILSAPYLALKMPVPLRRRLLAAVLNRLAPSLLLRSGIRGPMLTHDAAMLAADEIDPHRGRGATARWFTAATRAQAQVRAAAERFTLPLLLLIPDEDTVADPAADDAWFARVGSTDKTVHHYPSHRHELLREVGREAVLADVAAWMRGRAA